MGLIRNRNYLLLRTGWSISSLGSQLQSFAFALYVLAVTGSSTQFAVTLCMQFLPCILLAPFVGYFSDRFNRKRQIVLYDLLSALSVALLFSVYIEYGKLAVWQIYLCVFALSTLQTFTNPVGNCLIQAAVDPADYTRQRSVDATISGLIMILAPALAGTLYGLSSLRVILIFNAASFLVSAVMESLIFVPQPKAARVSGESVFRSFFGSVREGARFIRANRFIMSFLITLTPLNFILTSLDVSLMVVSQKLLHLNSILIGAENSILSVGTLASALLCGALNRRMEKFSMGRIIIADVLATTAAFALICVWLLFACPVFAASANLILFVTLNLIIVVANNILSINLGARFQREVPNELMGRVGAFVNAALTAVVPLGQIVAGVLMGVAPYFVLYLAEGLLCLALFIFSVNNERKSVIIKEKAQRETA